eukprot:363400-Chlamydomonas_euryale.AAC.5
MADDPENGKNQATTAAAVAAALHGAVHERSIARAPVRAASLPPCAAPLQPTNCAARKRPPALGGPVGLSSPVCAVECDPPHTRNAREFYW